MRALRSTLTVGIVTALPLVLTPPAYADDIASGHDNLAYAEALASHPVVRAVAFDVTAARGTTVDQTNEAAAYNHDCTGCRSVAIAFQAVLVPSAPTSIVPQNGAVVLNERCTDCHGFAYADQYVVSSNGRTSLSDRTMEQIEDIQEQAERLSKSALSDADLTTALNNLATQFRSVVKAAVSNPTVSREDRESDRG